jgi:phosphosulfolactate synthase
MGNSVNDDMFQKKSWTVGDSGVLRLSLPDRPGKPRTLGLTSLIDPGVPTGHFRDVIESHGLFIDHVKFGWGSSLITKDLREKLAILEAHAVSGHFGGTLFEKAVACQQVDAYRQWCLGLGCQLVEISTSSLRMDPSERAQYIANFAQDFIVLSEVGSKLPDAGDDQPAAEWIRWMREDFASGASYVILEARESGTSGICRPTGELRKDLITAILASDLPVNRLIFEAPGKGHQVHFIHLLGPNVNLANIGFGDSLSLESLRLGLRADTFDLHSR